MQLYRRMGDGFQALCFLALVLCKFIWHEIKISGICDNYTFFIMVVLSLLAHNCAASGRACGMNGDAHLQFFSCSLLTPDGKQSVTGYGTHYLMQLCIHSFNIVNSLEIGLVVWYFIEILYCSNTIIQVTSLE